MSYVRRENFEIPKFCEGCPALDGIDIPQISIVTANNEVANSWGHVGAKILAVTDAGQPEDTVKSLGEEVRPTDPFCDRYENGTSVALGRVHDKVNICPGPSQFKIGPVVLSTSCEINLMPVKRHLRQLGVKKPSQYTISRFPVVNSTEIR
jgi:hypothetical protein